LASRSAWPSRDCSDASSADTLQRHTATQGGRDMQVEDTRTQLKSWQEHQSKDVNAGLATATASCCITHSRHVSNHAQARCLASSTAAVLLATA
jgi:hypothetical protein